MSEVQSMSTLLTALKARYAKRPDSEHEQAIVRIVIVCLFLIYLMGLLSTASAHTTIVVTAFKYVLIDAFVGGGILIWLTLRTSWLLLDASENRVTVEGCDCAAPARAGSANANHAA